MALSITVEQQEVLQGYVTRGDTAGGWQYLSQMGDRYADNTYEVIGNVPTGTGEFFETLVKEHWINTVGKDVYDTKFNEFALKYFEWYAGRIQANNGTFPNQEEIEGGYRGTAENMNLPPIVAFDGVFTRGLGQDLPNGFDWPFWLNMEPGRMSPDSTVFNDIDKEAARTNLRDTIRDTLHDLDQRDKLQESLEALVKAGMGNVIDDMRDVLRSKADALWKKLHDFVMNSNEKIKSLIDEMRDYFTDSKEVPMPPRCCPLVIDLDGDGTETTSLKDGAYFDHGGDGFTEQTGWVGRDDGLLVWDRNNDGRINDGTELFGDNTMLKNGLRAADGFEALREWDDNQDGKIDVNDAVWSNLKVWKDADGDGLSLPSELVQLQDLSIQSINTSATILGTPDGQNNIQTYLGTFTRTDGTTGQVNDYLFQVNDFNAFNDESVNISDEIAVLPNLSGYGSIVDLHQAMARDTSGGLKILVESFIAEQNPVARSAILDEIIFMWTGSDGVDPVGRSYLFDARKLVAMEKLFSDDFYYHYDNGIRWVRTNDPNGLHIPFLDKSYSGLHETFYAQLMTQTHLKELYGLVQYTWDAATESVKIDLSAVIVELQNKITADRAAGAVILGEFARSLRALDGEQMLTYYNFREFFAQQGDDLAWAIDSVGSTILSGTVNDDYLVGTKPYFALNDPDYITEINGNNAIQGGDGADEIIGGAGNDALYGQAGADSLYGQDGNDVLLGGAGDDFLEGHADNDILDGGTGNDFVSGGDGNDIYIFGNGYGVDTFLNGGRSNEYMNDIIQMRAGVAPADVSVTVINDDIELSLNGGLDRLNFSSDGFREVRFSDGTVWSIEFIAEKGRVVTQGSDTLYGIQTGEVIHGQGGDDFIDGRGGGDALYGDSGNDLLYAREGAAFLSGGDGADVLYSSSGNGFSGYAVFDGGKGDDTFGGNSLKNIYLFGLGSGRDTINAGSGATTIIMGTGILPADVLLRRDQLDPNTFRLEIKGTMDSITIPASSSSHLRSTVQFENGVIWTSVEFSQIALQSTSTGDDFLIGAANNDVITGLGGNDTLWGKAGNDVLEGGAGNDNLLGWEGNDTLDGGAGNDSLGGMAGNDLYRFGKGSGNDTIGDGAYRGGNKNTAGDMETVELASGILPQDVVFSRGGYQGADLILAITGTPDTLTVSGWFDQDDNNTLKLKFADGTEWNSATINIKAPIAAPTSGIDYLYGDVSNNILNGAAGNDIIRGNAGDDVIDGGAGNDDLSGGSGSDTFIFGHGSGADILFDYKELLTAEDNDVIQFTADVTPGDVTLSNNGSSLIIRLNGSTDSLTLGSWSTTDNRVKQARFTDGTVWNLTQSPGGAINGTAAADTINGTSYDDVIYGLGGNDTLVDNVGYDALYGGAGNDVLIARLGNDLLDGGAGNDTLYAEGSNNTYVFGRNYGQDIMSGDGIIRFNADILPSDIVLRQSNTAGANLEITLVGSLDTLTIEGWFIEDVTSYAYVNIKQFQFADGTLWERPQINSKIITSVGTAGKDFLYGTSGDNVLEGFDADDLINANAGNDVLRGGAGDDRMYGEAGNDTLEGGTGNDDLTGGEGGDTYVFGRGFGRDIVREWDWQSLGNKIVFSGNILPNEIAVSADSANLYLDVRGTGDRVTVVNWFANTPTSAIGSIEFSNGTVWDATLLKSKLLSATSEDDRLYGSDGNDSIDGLSGNDDIYGFSGNDMLLGGKGQDALYGDDGDDTLDGGKGNDQLRGDRGNDTYMFSAGFGHDVLMENDAATGNLDTLQFAANIPQSNISLLRQSDDLVLTAGVADQLTILNYFASNAHKIERIVFADGTAWDAATIEGKIVTTNPPTEDADILVGTVDNDVIDALGGNDTVSGDAGNDILDGGTGADSLFGNSGDDVYGVDSIGDVVTELAGEGTDTVQSTITYTLGVHLENLTLIGINAINGTGNELNNILVGNVAANILDGAAGTDTLQGGAGDDTYVVDNVGDVITENFAEGIDTVQSTITYTLGTHLENLTLMGISAINGTGNDLSNTLVGNAAANILDGAAGADTLQGGAGNDTYVVDNVGDVITENLAEGTDTVQSGVTYTLATNLENLTLIGTAAINGTGNALNNLLIGNAAANILDGAAGADTLQGGAGDDTYIRDNTADVITELAGGGIDTVQTNLTYTLATNLENLTLTGTTAINGTGNALDNVLVGNSAINTLTGSAGNDTLDGMAGADKLTGGTGNDTYVVDNTGDVVTELANEGTDTVQSTITHTLGANVENLALMGTAAINATGNTLNNTLLGNSAANTLSGGTGADQMKGGAGNDTYMVDNTADVITELVNEGTDTAQSSVTYTLAANVENLTLTGTSAINGTGNTLDNVLMGNSAVNTLTGGAGNDTLNGLAGADKLTGGAGDDIYVRDNASEVITELANEGIDTVQSNLTYTLVANVENLTLTGTTAINGTGNTLDNVLTGNSAVNTLTGSAGNDTLNGLAGADKLTGGTGNDTYVVDNTGDVVTELANEGTDTVQSALTYTLGANVENLTLTGTAAINGTGNTLNNVLTGNSTANTLTGGTGNDTYLFGRGAGQDSVNNLDTASTDDKVVFGATIATDQLWFTKDANHLRVSIIGTADQITIQDWYSGSNYTVNKFQTSNGSVLLENQVQQLVNAMASMTPPPAGQLTLAPEQQTALNPVLAASWQSAA